jgi:hypothetical protein
MGERRSALLRGRHFRDEIIVLCLRRYLRYPLSYRDLEEMIVERGLAIDHSTTASCVLWYAPVLNERIRSEMRNPNRSWRVDETYIRVAGGWTPTAGVYGEDRSRSRVAEAGKAHHNRGFLHAVVGSCVVRRDSG